MAGEKITRFPTEQFVSSNMELLRSNPYSGRGIIMGFNKEGDQAIQIYWVMGRSENSRNRFLVQREGIVRTVPFDVNKVKDPTLIIYTAMRTVGRDHLVSNGDQTDSVAQKIECGSSFEESLKEITYEPDKPNFTPRITGKYSPDSQLPFSLSLIRKNSASNPNSLRTLQSYLPEKGIGQCIHTYKGDDNPLPSFDSDSYPVILEGSINQIAQTYWNLLNSENRVALVVKGIDTTNGKMCFSIINKLCN